MAYFSNHASSTFILYRTWRSSAQRCGSRGATYKCVGTPLLFSARYISTDCGSGTRTSFWPTRKMVGVVTFQTSLSGELSQYTLIGASFCQGVPPNQGVR